jgi:predicted chitinase
MHLLDWAGYKARDDLDRPEFWEEASYIVNTQNGGLNVRATPRSNGTILAHVAKGSEITIAPAERGFSRLVSIISGAAEPSLTPGNGGQLPGYVATQLLKARHVPKDTDQVVVLEQPIHIEAGQLIGYPGVYQNYNGPAQALVHLEVFSCEDIPGFISRSQNWATSLPEAEKRLLKVYKEASRLIQHRDGMNASDPPKRDDAGSEIGNDLIIPQALLDGLPAANKIKVESPAVGGNEPQTTQWWRLDGLFEDLDGNPINGWLAEQDLITTRHSPWEWLDFQCVEDTSSPLEKLAYSFNSRDMLDPQEIEAYQAQISSVDSGPLLEFARLHGIVDTDKDSKLSSSEIRVAFRKPWQAQMLGQLIIRHESEWYWDKAKWDGLDPLMEEERGTLNQAWEKEKQRIEALSWWQELAGKHGVSENGRAWHFHGPGLVGIFAVGQRVLVSVEMLKNVFERLRATSAKDVLLTELANQINQNAEKYKLDNNLRLSHFFAQIRQEIGGACFTQEDFTYSVEGLKATFSYFRRHPDEAAIYGYGAVRHVSEANQQAIASRAYALRIGNGSIASGDGWLYRGRGLKHLTGRANYRDFSSFHKDFWGEDIDFTMHPHLAHENPKYVVRSGVYFWLKHKLYREADKGSGPEAVDAITRIINRDTDSYEARRRNFERIYNNEKIFHGI